MFEFLRKKTVEIDLPAGDGKTRTLVVSQKKFDGWAKKDYVTRVVFVNALDCPAETGTEIFHYPNRGRQQKVTWQWKIGTEIDLATYERFKDRKGNLHAMTVWKEGKKEIFCVTKAQYEEGCRIWDLDVSLEESVCHGRPESVTR